MLKLRRLTSSNLLSAQTNFWLRRNSAEQRRVRFGRFGLAVVGSGALHGLRQQDFSTFIFGKLQTEIIAWSLSMRL